MSEQLALLPGHLTAHLQLTLVALALGVGISVPLGIWLTRRPRYEPPVLGLASVIQTIPSLALLAVMVPILAGLGALLAGTGIDIRGIGYTPALIALTLYSVLPVLRNTVTGIAELDPAYVEAARAVGMTDRQRLWRVELPLSMPVLVAGIRTAAVWVVGTATLSTPIGATSLGNFIFSGLATRNDAAVLVGCIASAGLALVLDGLIRGIERGARERSRPRLWLSLAGLGALSLYTAASFLSASAATRPITIGSKAFTEQYILAQMLAVRVEETGNPTKLLPSLGSTFAFEGLANGDLDAYVDYSGTVWATIMKRTELPERRDAVTEEVARFLEAEHGIGLIASLGFENTYALGMRRAHAESLGVTRISQLARVAPGLEIGGDYEFFDRAEWKALEATYGLRFAKQRPMDPSLMYQAVAEEEVDVISAFSTDGRIATYDLVLLEDDRGVIPPYDAILLVSARMRSEHPEVVEALRRFDGILDAATMQRLNQRVDGDSLSTATVAREWLESLP
jgi:osmoprotectant transport system permease protein